MQHNNSTTAAEVKTAELKLLTNYFTAIYKEFPGLILMTVPANSDAPNGHGYGGLGYLNPNIVQMCRNRNSAKTLAHHVYRGGKLALLPGTVREDLVIVDVDNGAANFRPEFQVLWEWPSRGKHNGHHYFTLGNTTNRTSNAYKFYTDEYNVDIIRGVQPLHIRSNGPRDEWNSLQLLDMLRAIKAAPATEVRYEDILPNTGRSESQGGSSVGIYSGGSNKISAETRTYVSDLAERWKALREDVGKMQDELPGEWEQTKQRIGDRIEQKLYQDNEMFSDLMASQHCIGFHFVRFLAYQHVDGLRWDRQHGKVDHEMLVWEYAEVVSAAAYNAKLTRGLDISYTKDEFRKNVISIIDWTINVYQRGAGNAELAQAGAAASRRKADTNDTAVFHAINDCLLLDSPYYPTRQAIVSATGIPDGTVKNAMRRLIAAGRLDDPREWRAKRKAIIANDAMISEFL